MDKLRGVYRRVRCGGALRATQKNLAGERVGGTGPARGYSEVRECVKNTLLEGKSMSKTT